MDPTAVSFLINNEIVTLYPQDAAVREKFRQDHSFAMIKIVELVNKGRITLNEPISRIALLHNDYEQVIYEVDTNRISDDENTDLIDQNIVEDSVITEPEQSHSTPGNSQIQIGDVWGDLETKYVLDQYYIYMTQIEPMKIFRRKKDMWNRISLDFQNKYNIYRSPLQIENRYKTVVRRKKDAVNNNSQSGNSRHEVPYEAELKKIAALDDSIEPEIIRSAKRVRVLKESQLQNVSFNSDDDDQDDGQQIEKKKITKQMEEKLKKRKSNLSTAQLIKMLHTEKEAAKQKRHEEKVQLMRELFGNIQDENDESE